MVDQAKLQEVFSDKEYVASIVKLSAEDAAKSLNEKGVDVTADDLMKLHDFILAHKDELQNGELSEETLAEISGGLSSTGWWIVGGTAAGAVAMYGLAMAAAFFAW